MSVRFYMDVNVSQAVTTELRRRGLDVLTAQVDGDRRWSDQRLLERATALGRVVVTHDADFLALVAKHQRRGAWFCGVIYGPQLRLTVGQCIRDVELLAGAGSESELVNVVTHLPL